MWGTSIVIASLFLVMAGLMMVMVMGLVGLMMLGLVVLLLVLLGSLRLLLAGLMLSMIPGPTILPLIPESIHTPPSIPTHVTLPCPARPPPRLHREFPLQFMLQRLVWLGRVVDTLVNLVGLIFKAGVACIVNDVLGLGCGCGCLWPVPRSRCDGPILRWRCSLGRPLPLPVPRPPVVAGGLGVGLFAVHCPRILNPHGIVPRPISAVMVNLPVGCEARRRVDRVGWERGARLWLFNGGVGRLLVALDGRDGGYSLRLGFRVALWLGFGLGLGFRRRLW